MVNNLDYDKALNVFIIEASKRLAFASKDVKNLDFKNADVNKIYNDCAEMFRDIKLTAQAQHREFVGGCGESRSYKNSMAKIEKF